MLFSNPALTQHSDDGYYPAMADMLAGMVFIFMIVAMTFAVHTMEMSQTLQGSDCKATEEAHNAALSNIAARLREEGFDAIAYFGEDLVRIKRPGIFATEGLGFASHSPCLIDSFSEILVDVVRRCGVRSTAAQSDEVPYRQVTVQLHATGSQYISGTILTRYRALALSAQLLERNLIFATFHGRDGSQFFDVVGLGDTRIADWNSMLDQGPCDFLDIVLTPESPCWR